MKKRRRLGDLYIRGREFTVDDGTDDPVTVWIQKMNEIERDSILRRANAAKARYTLEAGHQEGELFVATLGSIQDYLDRDGMLDVVAAEHLFRLREKIEAQLTEDEDGWGKDNKIKGLLDLWTGTDEEPGLAATWAEDENDPEALRVKTEIEAFNAEVDQRVEDEKEQVLREWQDMTDADLARLTTKEILKRRADEVFMREWMRQQLFHSVREVDNHHTRYFGVIAEVDDLDDRVREKLEKVLNLMVVSNTEGKDSPLTDSSNSSEPPSTEETSTDSGQEAASA